MSHCLIRPEEMSKLRSKRFVTLFLFSIISYTPKYCAISRYEYRAHLKQINEHNFQPTQTQLQYYIISVD